MMGLIIGQHVVHGHTQLVLSSIQVTKRAGVTGVGLGDSNLWILSHQHLLGLIESDGFEKTGCRSQPTNGLKETIRWPSSSTEGIAIRQGSAHPAGPRLGNEIAWSNPRADN